MSVARGYRIPLDGAAALGDLLAGIRGDALRVFTRRYGTVLADDVARRVDLHRAGLLDAAPDTSPLKDSVEALRTLLAAPGRRPARANLDFRIRVHLVEDQALLSVEDGHEDYVAGLEGIPGMVAAPYAAGSALAGAVEAESARLWEAALAGPSLMSGLSFRLLDPGLPSMRYATLRRFFPDHSVRCRRTARATVFRDRAGAEAPRDAEEAREFRRYLDSSAGRAAMDQATRRLARELPATIEREDVSGYGGGRARPDAKAVRMPEPVSPEPPRQIDHADVIESGDGRVFVAVMEAGLSTDDRLHIQVVDREVAFVQNGVHFGGVSDAPRAAVDLLRETREAIVVEIRRTGGQREIKARHVAIVRDDSLAGIYGAAMLNFRNSTARARQRGDTQWLEKN